LAAVDRLLEIEEAFGDKAARIVPLELDGDTLRLILFLKDGTNVRVTEQWEAGRLKRYSYYWLFADGALKTGWDNAPHHTKLETYPHHKHVGSQKNLQPSAETRLEEVMSVVLAGG
jgi:hypothetical protein